MNDHTFKWELEKLLHKLVVTSGKIHDVGVSSVNDVVLVKLEILEFVVSNTNVIRM